MPADVFEVLDKRFAACVKSSARLDHLYDGCRWAEGPAYFPAGRYLVFMPTTNHIGVSRRIADEQERKRLKELVTSLRPPEGGGDFSAPGLP